MSAQGLSVTARRLRQARKKLGINQSDLSYRARVPQSQLSCVENDRRKLSVEHAKRIAKVLGVKAAWLLDL